MLLAIDPFDALSLTIAVLLITLMFVAGLDLSSTLDNKASRIAVIVTTVVICLVTGIAVCIALFTAL